MHVLVVDDEIKNAELTALELRDAGHQVEFVGASHTALKRLEAETFDVVVTDLRMAPPDGLALLGEIRTRWPATAVVLMTAYSTKETARQALNDGATGYVDKEGEFRAELKTILERVARERQLEGTVRSLRKGLAPVVGESPAIRQAVAAAQKVAASKSTVLLLGESGTGKDLFARTIHFASPRVPGPWVKVNCGALPEALLESELFGHEKGAFTGAIRQKPGRFEDADGGTLFLDEIGELPMSMQVKLLQAIEERTFTRVGGNRPITVDVRLIAATNRDLAEMVKAREFREDLFYRLNVIAIRLPSLRERPGDIPALVAYFLEARGIAPERVTPEAMRLLAGHPFPGNVRELENTLERATILAGSDPIGPEHLSFAGSGPLASFPGAASGPAWVPVIPPEGLSLEVLERELILRALDMARGNKSQAARLLGLTRRTLYSRMEKHGLRKPGDSEGGDELGGEDEGDAGDVSPPGTPGRGPSAGGMGGRTGTGDQT